MNAIKIFSTLSTEFLQYVQLLLILTLCYIFCDEACDVLTDSSVAKLDVFAWTRVESYEGGIN